MAEFNWTVDDIKRAQCDFSNNFMRLDCIRTESYDVAIDCMTECIEKKATDVQPVNQWISVNDRLPETNAIGIAHILAYDKYEGVVKADYLDESANYRYGSDIFIISNTSAQLYKVTHWMPLPEPPKDGDIE